MPGTETRSTSVEGLLERHLGPVKAPAELWDRVENPRPRSARGIYPRLGWALAAALLVVVAASGFHARQVEAASEAMALQALAHGPEILEFQSSEPAQIRTWVKTQTGLDIPFRTPSPSARLIGAHVVTPGVAAVEVAYRVGDRKTALVVSKGGFTVGERHFGERHWGFNKESYRNLKTLSWTTGGQTYTLACANPGDLQFACRVCHADSEVQTAVN